MGNSDQASRLRVHRALAYVHPVGMILMPVLGILAAYPAVVGLRIDPANPEASQRTLQDYQATLRTVHLTVGYVTLGVVNGPATTALPHYLVTVCGGIVFVDVTMMVDATTRATG